jgi:hypothetical protein
VTGPDRIHQGEIMRNTSGRLACLAWAAAVVVLALGLATPAAAQFGGLRKKLKQAGAQEGANKAAEKAGATAPDAAQPADVPAGGGAGGQVVLTDDVVKQLLAGLKAGKDERDAAAKEDTPYGRYHKAQLAYADAKPKCEAAQQAWPTRAAADEKLMARYSAMTEKMVNAAQNQKLYLIYADSAMAMMSPSCVVKQPTQPDDYSEMHRDVDSRAEKAEMKASGMSRSELAMARERAEAVLRDAPGPDISASEKNAVNSHAAELKRLMNIDQVPPAQAEKPAPAAAPAPAPAAPAAPTVSPGQQAMGNCMAANAQKHEKEIQALGDRGQAAQKNNDTATMMAIADSINRLTMAGCNRDQ